MFSSHHPLYAIRDINSSVTSSLDSDRVGPRRGKCKIVWKKKLKKKDFQNNNFEKISNKKNIKKNENYKSYSISKQKNI